LALQSTKNTCRSKQREAAITPSAISIHLRYRSTALKKVQGRGSAEKKAALIAGNLTRLKKLSKRRRQTRSPGKP
jgi:hypothetical protein